MPSSHLDSPLFGARVLTDSLPQAIAEPRDSPRREPVVPDEEGRPLVLVVEDHPDLNRFLSILLGMTYRVISAFDGNQGWEKAQMFRPDLIMTDLMMPVMNGHQLVQAVRARADMNDIPIILATARTDEKTRLQSLRAGVQVYLIKPIVAEELLARVASLIRAKKAKETMLPEKPELAAEAQGEVAG